MNRTHAGKVAAEVDRRLSLLTIAVPSAAGTPGAGTPAALDVKRFDTLFLTLGTSAIDVDGQPAVDAQFVIRADQLASSGSLFSTMLDGCRLTAAT